MLKEKGYEVRAVADGQDAVAELDAREYDAIISDVLMPRPVGGHLSFV